MAACLTAAGLNDYIASDFGNYIELSVAKAHDLFALAELRKTLRNRIKNTDFGDPDRYTRAVEAQYRSIWQQWCKNQNGTAS